MKLFLKDNFSKADLIHLLATDKPDEQAEIYDHAAKIRKEFSGNDIYLRGLIEYSNMCEKNCYYCGIRAGNKKVHRYNMSEEDVLRAAKVAHQSKYGSVVIQSGERTDAAFVDEIDSLLKKIKSLSGGKLGITLSCGEQTKSTYKRWFDSGAHRYLLRFESSSPELYYKLHPNNRKHFLLNRLSALQRLREIGYQVGSGMMIGVPGQTIENLADDLIMLKTLDVDMVGMGPYIEHQETPLFAEKNRLLSYHDRLSLSLLTVAVLRIYMPDVNIAAGTALDSLAADGRLKAIRYGANVLMPNLTPLKYRENYFLYQNKPYLTEADELIKKLTNSSELAGFQVQFNKWGDSKHYHKRTN